MWCLFRESSERTSFLAGTITGSEVCWKDALALYILKLLCGVGIHKDSFLPLPTILSVVCQFSLHLNTVLIKANIYFLIFRETSPNWLLFRLSISLIFLLHYIFIPLYFDLRLILSRRLKDWWVSKERNLIELKFFFRESVEFKKLNELVHIKVQIAFVWDGLVDTQELRGNLMMLHLMM